MASTIPVKIEFTYAHRIPLDPKEIPNNLLTSSHLLSSGGLEILFASQRSHKIALPTTDPSTSQPANVGFLIDWLCKNLRTDPREDMFVLEGTVYEFSPSRNS